MLQPTAIAAARVKPLRPIKRTLYRFSLSQDPYDKMVKSFCRPVIFLSVILLTAAFVCAQKDAPKNGQVRWTTVISNSGEFAIDLPEDFRYFYDRIGFVLDPPGGGHLPFGEMQLLNAAAENTVMSVEIYQVPGGARYMRKLIEQDKPKGIRAETKVTGLEVQTFTLDKMENYRAKVEVPIFFVAQYIADKDHVYKIVAANRGSKASATAERFLGSFRLGTAAAAPVTEGQKAVSLAKLTPVTIDDIAFDDRKNNDPIDDKEDSPEEVGVPAADRMLLISQPTPTFTPSAIQFKSDGTINFRAVFDKNGGISRVYFRSMLKGGLSSGAFFALMRCKFLPQEKDGKLTAVTRPAHYTFTLY
jgi:hypothetical protein